MSRPRIVPSREHIFHDFDQLDAEGRYWLGFLYTDGNVFYCKKQQPYVIIGLKESDIGHLEKFKNYIGAKNKIRHVVVSKSVRLQISSKAMADDLGAYGIVPNKSLVCRVDERLKDDPDFWRGVVDGDGSLCLVKKRYPRVSLAGNKFTCQAFVEFIQRRTGCTARASICGKNTRIVHVPAAATIPLLNLLYSNATVFLDRKMEMYKQFLWLLRQDSNLQPHG